MSKDYILLHHVKMPSSCQECFLKKQIDGREHCIFTMDFVDDLEFTICQNDMCPLQRPENNRETPKKNELEEIACELFKSDFALEAKAKCWKVLPSKLKNYYCKLAKVVITAWEFKRNH